MRWGRAISGGLLAEVLVLALMAPVAFAVGFDNLGAPGSVPVLNYAIVVASFAAPLVLMQWVARRVTSRFVLHGAIVGLTAFAVYMIPAMLSAERQPMIYWIAHAMKIAGGMTGGLIAGRRHSVPSAPVARL